MSFWRRLREKGTQQVPFCAAVVPAAGSSTRMEGQDKLLLPLAGEAVILHTLRALQNCPLIREIVVVTRSDLILPIGELCQSYGLDKVTKLLVGGDTRAQSVQIGTLEVSPEAKLIAVHDGARPLVCNEVLEAVILQAAKCNAAAPAVPMKDTVKRVRNGQVVDTPPREELRAVQTPQVFEASLLKAALQKAVADGGEMTDDCAAVERLGMKITLTAGDDTNLKITTPADLAAAEGILAWRAIQ